MLRRGLFAAWITAVWVALWGDLSWANVVGGVVVAGLVLAGVRVPTGARSRGVAPWPALRYAARFGRDLCVATAQVAAQVFWPIGRLRPAVVRVQLATSDPLLLSLVANTITLTPGTLTLEVDPDRSLVWVHVLHLVEGGEGDLTEAVLGLERLGAAMLRVDAKPLNHNGGAT